ncbi:MAG: universal stress protein [Mycobacteriaceae bacterium]|jgi:nucleotide-binding universal stress UspA family protein
MPEQFTPASIVVGIDGSRTAVRAALWAIDEAISRDVPLHLVAVANSPAARADAELAVRAATAAVEATGRPVDLDSRVLDGEPTPILLTHSGTAAMVCVGAVGRRHFDRNRLGSTTGALVAAAHCPIAVVRGDDGSAAEPGGWVVAELDETPDSAAVLQFGVAEARLRNAPLRVLGAWQSRYTDVHDSHAVADGNRLVRSQLDRRLSQWRHQYPDLDAKPVAIHGSALNYLSKHAGEIQLVVVGAPNATGVGDLLGPMGLTTLNDTDCTIVVVDRQRLL